MREQAQIAIENATVIIFLTRYQHRRDRRRSGGREYAAALAASRSCWRSTRWTPSARRTRTIYEFYNLGPGRPHRGLRRPRPRHRRPAGRLRGVLPAGGRGGGGRRRHQGGRHRQARTWASPRWSTASWARSASSSPTWRAPPATPSTPALKTSTGKYCLHRHRRHAQEVQGRGRHREIQRPARDHGHRPRGRLPHHDRRHRGRHRAGHQGRRACARGGQGLHHRGQQVGPGGEGRQDHGQDARGHPPRSELYDLRAHPVHLRADRPAGGRGSSS